MMEDDPPRQKRTAKARSTAIVNAPRGSGRRIRGAVVDYLGQRIVTGDIDVGETLPGEIETAERLDISRGTYREAVKTLSGKGLVESRPKTGTRVLDRARWNLLDPDVLRWAFVGKPDARLVSELFEMGSDGQGNRRDIHRRRGGKAGGRCLVAAGGQHHPVKRVAVDEFDQRNMGEVAVQRGRGAVDPPGFATHYSDN